MSKIHKHLKQSLDDMITLYDITGEKPTIKQENIYKDYLRLTRGREQKYMTFMSNYFKEKHTGKGDTKWYQR